MEPPLIKQDVTYYTVGSENPEVAHVLTAGASEATTYGYAIFVVNNNEMIVPTIDDESKMTGWSKVTFDHIAPSSESDLSLFTFNVVETDLQQLIGEVVDT